MNRRVLNFTLVLALISLTGCTRYEVKTYYDEFKKCNACSIHNYRLKTERSLFKAPRFLDVDIDKFENGKIQVYFSLSGTNKESFFKPSSQILVKIAKANKGEKEYRLIQTTSVQNKSWETANYGYKGMVVGYSQHNLSVFSTEMTEEQIFEMVDADKVILVLETINEPFKTEINKEDLLPLQEFVQKCFK